MHARNLCSSYGGYVSMSPARPLRLDERAQLLVAFANSEHLGVDQLATASDIAFWWQRLTGQQLPAQTASAGGLTSLQALRRLVHEAALRNNPLAGDVDPHHEQPVLRVDLAAGPDGQLGLVPAGATDAVSTVCAAVAESLLICAATRDWSRFRACAAPDCGWVFIDRSKNSSRRWCDMASCGNRAKARSHRTRRATQRGTAHR